MAEVEQRHDQQDYFWWDGSVVRSDAIRHGACSSRPSLMLSKCSLPTAGKKSSSHKMIEDHPVA